MEPTDPYAPWLGRTEEHRDTVTTPPAAALAAPLDRDDLLPEVGTVLPPLRHWLYVLPLHRQSELGPDGALWASGPDGALAMQAMAEVA